MARQFDFIPQKHPYAKESPRKPDVIIPHPGVVIDAEVTYIDTRETPLEELQKEQALKLIQSIRPEVLDFALKMESVLALNDHKKGWDTLNFHHLMSRLETEFNELRYEYVRAQVASNDKERCESVQAMCNEALDIANYCMFLTHNYTGATE